MTCTQCGTTITVHLFSQQGRPLDPALLDPSLYTCPDCRNPQPGQLELDEEPDPLNVGTVDQVTYNPALAAIPY